MKILCLSDVHGEGAGLKEILPDASEVDVVVVAGDLTHLGGYAEAETVLAPLLESGAAIVAVAGNMDREGVREWLDEKAINIHGRGITIGQVGFMGLGGGTPSPFGTPWEISDEEAAGFLASGLAAISSCPYKVLVSHAPPRGTKIDRSFAGMHLGSGAVRDFLLAGSVDRCICGHIHESPGEDTLGRARCVNVGPFKNGRYALIAIEDGGAHVTWRKR
jgi:Icc-related predicted phosphoesterase